MHHKFKIQMFRLKQLTKKKFTNRNVSATSVFNNGNYKGTIKLYTWKQSVSCQIFIIRFRTRVPSDFVCLVINSIHLHSTKVQIFETKNVKVFFFVDLLLSKIHISDLIKGQHYLYKMFSGTFRFLKVS